MASDLVRPIQPGTSNAVMCTAMLWAMLLALAAPLAAQDTCLDATRTLLPGGPGNGGCRVYNNDAANCNASYIIGGSGPTSCYLQDDGDCEGCGPSNEGPDCINVCQPAPFCSTSRPNFVGGSGNEACRQFDGQTTQCNQAYHRGGDGEFASCFPTQVCDACGDDETGFCVNSCVPPPTCLDQSRTNFVGGPGTGACRQFAGNQAACEQAFHLGDDGVAPCFYDADDDECRGCGLRNESDLECVNTCIPQPTCLDQTRTTYAGGPGSAACRQYDGDQSACEAAFHRGGNGRPASCFWDTEDSECFGCGPSNEGDGDCVNTCVAPVPCLDQTRTIYTGPPGSEGCTRFNGDQAMCEQAYVEGADGVASCYYDAGDDACRGCGARNEDDGDCTNTCAATPTCLDQARTYAGGPGSEGCRQFDDDPTQCLQAFVRGEGGVASCFVEPDGDCRGCGPENVNDGECVNSCKVQPICGSDPDRTMLGCGRFDGNPAACATAYGLLDDGSPTSCVAVDLCLGCGPNNQEDGLCTNQCGAAAAPAAAPAMSWPVMAAVGLLLAALSYRRLRRDG